MPQRPRRLRAVEGNMLRTVMQGVSPLSPWSETPLRLNGTRRNLGDLISPTPLRRCGSRREVGEDEAAEE